MLRPTPEEMEKRKETMRRLYLFGWSIPQISKHLGYKWRGAAWIYIKQMGLPARKAGWVPKNPKPKTCEGCGEKYDRNMPTGRRFMKYYEQSRYCSRKCQREFFLKKQTSYRNKSVATVAQCSIREGDQFTSPHSTKRRKARLEDI